MRNPQEIIQELKHQLHWSQPNTRYNELSNLINELEASLQPKTQVVKETPKVEVIEETVVEEIETKTTKKTIKK